MPIRAYLQFYKSIAPFIATFTVICTMGLGIYWGFLLCISLGLLIGFFGFSTFRKEEYYFYYNLGLNKLKLLKATFIINILVGIPFFFILLILKTLFFG